MLKVVCWKEFSLKKSSSASESKTASNLSLFKATALIFSLLILFSVMSFNWKRNLENGKKEP